MELLTTKIIGNSVPQLIFVAKCNAMAFILTVSTEDR